MVWCLHAVVIGLMAHVTGAIRQLIVSVDMTILTLLTNMRTL